MVGPCRDLSYWRGLTRRRAPNKIDHAMEKLVADETCPDGRNASEYRPNVHVDTGVNHAGGVAHSAFEARRRIARRRRVCHAAAAGIIRVRR